MAANKDDFTVKKISPKLGGERGTRKPYGPTSSHDLVEQMEFLYVEVIQAINYDNTIVNPRGCPMVEVILGNYKSSTENLPIGPEMDWNQVFAFDKSKGDVLSVVFKEDQEIITKTLISKRNFKLAADIPSRTPPDARIAPQWYSAKGLWPGVLGKLEIGILGASGLKGKDKKRADIDSYVVAKYGNRWARTRTVVDNTSPKWNEQYSWDVYDMSTVLTIGV